MKFGRKSKAPTARGGSRGSSRGGAGDIPARPTTNHQLTPNTGSSGPGSAGYPNGPRTQLPTFFATRRPDGKQDKVIRKKFFFG